MSKEIKFKSKIFILAIIVLNCLMILGGSLSVFAVNVQEELVIPLVGGDWGFPDPFVHQPRDWGGVYTTLIFDTLVEEDEIGIIPWLAVDWELKEGGKLYNFKLRKNVKWQDGEDFNADDVVFTINYYKEKNNYLYDLSNISSINKINDYCVEFIMNEASVVDLYTTFKGIHIIPKHIWKDVEDPRQFHVNNPRKALIGTGPYILEDYQKEHGTYCFISNKNFWDGKPVVDKIITIPTGNPVLSLLKGEIAITMISPQEIDAFKNNSDFVIKELKPYHNKWLCFNLNDLHLKKTKFRYAIAHAINKQELLNRLNKGVGKLGSQGGLPRVHPMYNPNIKSYDYNPERANNLLTKLGYKDVNGDGYREDADGNKLQFTILTMGHNVRGAELVQLQLKKVGINTEIRANNRNTIDDLTRQGKFQIVYQMGGYGGLSGDPDLLRSNFSSDIKRSSFFAAYRYENAEFNKLAEQQKSETDPELRKDLIFKMQEIVAEDIPLYYLYGQGGYYVYNKNIYDGWFYPVSAPLLDRSKLEYCRGKK